MQNHTEKHAAWQAPTLGDILALVFVRLTVNDRIQIDACCVSMQIAGLQKR
jgi:hypothetical protein